MVSKLGDTRPVSSLLSIALLMLARPATSASVRFWLSLNRRAVRPKSMAGLSARPALTAPDLAWDGVALDRRRGALGSALNLKSAIAQYAN
jgi:hypothetical protein